MTVGYFSPMPPARTGVADYSAALVAAMRPDGTVSIGNPTTTIRLYHLGNNQLHRPIYERALAEPGVIVLHDAVLHHFFLGWLSERAYMAEFEHNYGAWCAGIAERLWRNRARSGADPAFFRYPMLKRVVECSRAVVVHNPGAARLVREHVPSARVFEIPHLLLPLESPPQFAVERLRAALEVPPSTFLFGVFGHLRESKRLTSVLRAFSRVRREQTPTALLVAGEFASSDLERALAGPMAELGVRRIGYTPDRDFALYAHAVDACINLRYPPAGETSGIAVRLMGIGKPVFITRGEEASNLPETAAVRIDPGLAETDMLAHFMSWAASCRYDAAAIGVEARRYAREYHCPDRIARMFWHALNEVYA